MNGRRENRKRKSTNDTALPEEESSFKGTVIPFVDTANIRKNLESLASNYEKTDNTSNKNVISELGKAIGAEQKGSSSQYVTIAAKNGNEVTIRLSDHNASVERMDNAGKDNAISIVISRKGNKGIQGTGKARIVEYYYSDKKLRQAGDGSLPSDAHGGILGRDDGHDRAGQGRQHVRRAGGGRRQLRAGLPGLGQRGRDGVPRRAGAAFHVGLRQGEHDVSAAGDVPARAFGAAAGAGAVRGRGGAGAGHGGVAAAHQGGQADAGGTPRDLFHHGHEEGESRRGGLPDRGRGGCAGGASRA